LTAPLSQVERLKAMDRRIPVSSRICAQREDRRRHELHRERVRSAKKQVDNSEPSVMSMEHLRQNLKREQRLEERYTEIDHENKILMKKMSHIMCQDSAPESQRIGGPQSLNRDLRKKELLRITRENHGILKRIQQAQPVYNHVEWEGNYRRTLGYLQNCSEHPLVLRKTHRPSSELIPIEAESPQEDVDSRYDSSRHLLPHISGFGVDVSEKDRSEVSAQDDMVFVLKEGRHLGDTFYLVEMCVNGTTLNVSAYDGSTGTTLGLVLKDRHFRAVHRECNGDYSLIAKRLRVDGARLLLDGHAHSPTKSVELRPSATCEELDADSMVVSRREPSITSIKASVELDSFGDPCVRLHGLTPSSRGDVSPPSSPP